jgi:hypothetical protein
MADNQDPLAALQKLLEDQKNQAGSTAPGADQSVSEAPGEEVVPTGPSAEDIAVLQAKEAQEDQLKIEEQLLKMKTELVDTPQYQARASQKVSNDADVEQKRLEERSQRIFQLKHLDP